MTIKIPETLSGQRLKPDIFITGLKNPRGILTPDDHTMLIIEAGSGIPGKSDGRLIKVNLSDPEQEVHCLLDQQPSMNMQTMMLRDEILGLSDIATDGESILASVTDYIQGSKLLRISPAPVTTLATIEGHLNSIVYHPALQSWFGIKPDSNTLVEFLPDGTERTVHQLQAMPDGQDAVPVCIIYEEQSQSFLVTLFSGETGRHPGRRGIDFEQRAGQVIRIQPETGECIPLVTGLTAPTGVALGDDDTLYVLELCSDYLEPLISEDSIDQCLHGGFKRHSGRLLAISLASGEVTVLAEQLDTPSNLKIHRQTVFVSAGMGIPGRPVPDARGKPVALTGSILRIPLD
ncbi:MAG: hypothetical protein ACR2PT_23165 [Endozoicomonas sp.]